MVQKRGLAPRQHKLFPSISRIGSDVKIHVTYRQFKHRGITITQQVGESWPHNRGAPSFPLESAGRKKA